MPKNNPQNPTLKGNIVSENVWYETTGEISRTYVFPNGEYTISRPKKVLVRKRPNGDSHRVISSDEDGKPVSHYVAGGWIAIKWHGVDRTEIFGW